MNFVKITDKRGERTTLVNLDNVKHIRKEQFGSMKEPQYSYDGKDIDEQEYQQLLEYIYRTRR